MLISIHLFFVRHGAALLWRMDFHVLGVMR